MIKDPEVLEKVIEMAQKVAEPYKFCCKLLSVLLIISLLANVYLYTHGSEILFEADDNIESDINQTNNN